MTDAEIRTLFGKLMDTGHFEWGERKEIAGTVDYDKLAQAHPVIAEAVCLEKKDVLYRHPVKQGFQVMLNKQGLGKDVALEAARFFADLFSFCSTDWQERNQ